MTPCPHCGQPVRDEYTHCPFCGTDVATGQRTETVRGGEETRDVVGGVIGCGLTALVYFYFGMGWAISREMLYEMGKFNPSQRASWMFAATHGIWIGFSLPIAVTGLLYLLLRRRYPVFARGLGYSCLAAVVFALGAPFLCSSSGPR
jgi:hypothetical protein